MQNNNPLVSVLISSFNHENYVLEAIRSVLRQTYRNIELLVIDDGSSDRTPQIVGELSEKYGFFFLSRENKGFTQTLNELVDIATGQYVCILASDDAFMLDKTEKQVKFLEENPEYGVCGGNFLAINGSGEIVKSQKIRPARDLEFDDIFLGLKPGIPAGSAMIRREILPTPAYDPDIQIEDLFLWLKLSEQGVPIHVLNDVVYYYRKHSSNSHKNIEQMYLNVMKVYEFFNQHENYQRCVDEFNIKTALRAAKMEQKGFARSILSKAPLSAMSPKILRTYYHTYKPW